MRRLSKQHNGNGKFPFFFACDFFFNGWLISDEWYSSTTSSDNSRRATTSKKFIHHRQRPSYPIITLDDDDDDVIEIKDTATGRKLLQHTSTPAYNGLKRNGNASSTYFSLGNSAGTSGSSNRIGRIFF